MLWPGAEQGGGGGLTEADEAPEGPADLLDQAANAADAGRRWQALALLRTVEAPELPAAQRSRFEGLSERLHDALAEEPYASAMDMISEGRTEEAGIVLERMQDLVPEADRTADLAAALGVGQRRPPSADYWGRALRDTYPLVRKGRYKEALSARRQLLKQFGADPERAQAARRAMGDLFDHWARRLLQGYPEGAALEEFFSALEAHRNDRVGGPSGEVLGELRLNLAQIYRDRGDYDLALGQYEAAINAAGGRVAARAKRMRDELRKSMADRPHEAAVFAAELQRRGLASDLWREHADPGGSQSIEGGILQMRARAAQQPVVVQRETKRPIRNLGCTVGVQFRLPQGHSLGTDGARAGIALLGTEGNSFEFAFDGQAYRVAARAAGVSAGGVVREAFGDEDQRWHPMALSYDFEAGILTVLVDEEQVYRYSMDVADFRLRVFLIAPPGQEAAVDLKDVFCRP
jgi:tetratricopeptide (TPR) repeat protein